jgi:DNA-directed RNA polymerase sigma subunit (sigma70/sigma32)
MNLHNVNESQVLPLLYKELAQYKPLTRSLEKELIIAAKSGDKSAKDKVIYSNMKFAISVAKKYANKNVPLEDFISEAFVGLLLAFDTFDVSRDVKFITHAVFYIQDRLSHIQQGVVKLPNTYRILRKKIHKTQSQLEQLHCGNIPLSFLEEHLELKKDQIQDYLYETVSLDEWFEKYEEELL